MGELDTIAAISTPPGEGGIGIVRLSGPGAFGIASEIFTPAKGKAGSKTKTPLVSDRGKVKKRRILYGLITDPETAEEIDEVLMTLMPAPNTYTKEDIVEINCHGGALPVGKTLDLVLKRGARLALPGEFTKRAFLNGRIDLTQAEAVLELIRAKSDEAEKAALAQLKGGLGKKIREQTGRLTGICAHLEAAIDFPEEDTGGQTEAEFAACIGEIRKALNTLSNTYEEGRLLRDGIRTAILGKPNVGKSSLLNALLGAPRAIVTEVPGTTRDVISEYMNLGGHALRIMDTAGIRKGEGAPEIEGVRRSLIALEEADIVLCVLDGSLGLGKEDFEIIGRIRAENKRCIFVINKTDLPRVWPPSSIENTHGRNILEGAGTVSVSAKTGQGIDALKERIIGAFSQAKSGFLPAAGHIITSIRQKSALERAVLALGNAIDAMRDKMPAEIVAMELRESLHELGTITGEVGVEEILAKIFDEFCIGK